MKATLHNLFVMENGTRVAGITDEQSTDYLIILKHASTFYLEPFDIEIFGYTKRNRIHFYNNGNLFAEGEIVLTRIKNDRYN